ncbi:MAG: hemerythrin domain-containing protein [Betaproteobacteria bacterium]|nr:hemerythrin domain-containing protein [Betaproteobacteria bacterium]
MSSILVSPAPDFSDPLGLLVACHGRIERQCATLLRLPQHIEHFGPDEQAAQAAAKALTYFNSSGRHHHQDEEEDLFPMLEPIARSRGDSAILDLIGELLAEHGQMDAAWQALQPFLEELAASRPVETKALPVDRFAAAYRPHMAKENDRLLPYASQALSPAQRAHLGRMMALRRQPRGG